ncbi:low molecular weight phosphotyrosine protein phosphatase [Alginatibacterium sediminis]|uniref:protein-tyrosine-phosphatase n=2 Tax=Alginatibacterium sediminis TaxID=2164068 RepID=A0A420EID4_9ALTE|nr:low molecular weight phosphotyrosine protein phosphatase [Alginatibacterium sediminis]
MGNICRSPSAQAVLEAKLAQYGILAEVDSAGTHALKGQKPDPRGLSCAQQRGYSMKGFKSRPVIAKDFQRFDVILASDERNFRDLLEQAPASAEQKIKRIMSFTESSFDEVPDPYYGGKRGFELVLDLLEDACEGFVKTL